MDKTAALQLKNHPNGEQMLEDLWHAASLLCGLKDIISGHTDTYCYIKEASQDLSIIAHNLDWTDLDE